MSWLERHIYQVGSTVEDAVGQQPDGVREGFVAVAQASLAKVPSRVGPETGLRFEADLLPHAHKDLQSRSCCLELQPALMPSLRTFVLGAAVEPVLDLHLAKIGFTFVDCTGCIPIGSEFEVAALFVRSGTLVGRHGRAILAPLADGFAFDAIFARPGQLSRQRLSWRLPGKVVTQARIPLDPAYVGETMVPTAMLREARLFEGAVVAMLTQVALGAILHAQLHKGTSRAIVRPGIGWGDPAVHLRRPDPCRPLLTVTQLF